MDEIPYSIVHSQRKTMAISVTRDGKVVVRCPMRVTEAVVSAFVKSHETWIVSHYQEVKERLDRRIVYTPEQVRRYREQARCVLTDKTAYWSRQMGVSYGRITIREQVTRWGSCSTRGNLNYNWKLILIPEELIDYVVVHELAHRREMNHSQRFWDIVERELPDFRQRRKALRGYEDKVNT